ncbi:MAG: tRNA (guanosine(37)-N1)-methyltransferase TrmD [Tissierellia bacterium]|nr:tRNA (guanosine(37)-N1)-methyltransferase TrmD [Tissierellia bacterium]
MKIDVLTLFPELFDVFRRWSIISRAIEQDILSLNTINIRDFSHDKHKRVDDYPFGGGPGMVMRPEPIDRAISSIRTEDSVVIYLSPQGRTHDQQLANALSEKEHLILLCGHYEGVDSRVVDNLVDMEVSIGDYVLTGGEIPALVLIESVIRLLPGTLASEESYIDESHYDGILEHNQYTRPRSFKGFNVPEVLLSGDHGRIAKWRKYSALKNTYIKRPDLLEGIDLAEEEADMLSRIMRELEKEE